MISKLCDCGELDRTECQCAFFESDPVPWEDVNWVDDVDGGDDESTGEIAPRPT